MVTFERQHQYSLLFGRLEADQFISYKDRASPHVYLIFFLKDVTHVTFCQASPSVLHTASDQNLERVTALEQAYDG